ncbi:MAG: hypothetical protein WBE13_23310 [Candidatus Acidiferrum sp.]
MKPTSLRFSPFLSSFLLLASLAPAAPASTDRDTRDVRIAYVQGDVRLSRGNGKHPDLKKPWEQAQRGEPLEQGFALATGNGSAEVDFENGSAAYLAENSLLLFSELSSPRGRDVSGLTLLTGTATFWLHPAGGESLLIETPTDRVLFRGPQTYFLRFDAYLDATAITPQGAAFKTVLRKGMKNLQIPEGQTVFFRGGAILRLRNSNAAFGLNGPLSSDFAYVPEIRPTIGMLRDSGILPPTLAPQEFAGSESAETQADLYPQFGDVPSRPGTQLLVGRDWDLWVDARVQKKVTTMAEALKASGLASPIPGLADLYSHGNFFACEPYGTCWEPSQSQMAQESGAKTSLPPAQAPSPNSANAGFQPQTVQWQEAAWSGPCDFYGGTRTITRVAHTPEELKDLLRLQSSANSRAYYPGWDQESCYGRSWIYRRGHYAMVLPRTPGKCSGKGCAPVHPPRPVFARVNGKVGFVPRHPGDVKGQPPINLKYGIFLLPVKPGEAVQRIAWDPSQKLTFLNKPPGEFDREFVSKQQTVAAPEIRAHLMQEAKRGYALSAANRADSRIVFDYKSQQFRMPAATAGGARGREVAVAGIASNGRIDTFANGGSSRYAGSFGRSSAASSYSGGGYSGSRSFSSGSSSSGGSFGGSSSHSSGGGGFASSSSSGGSSGAGASGGGRSH